jgi:hypothetical protein
MAGRHTRAEGGKHGAGQHRGPFPARPWAGGLVWRVADGAVGLNGAAAAVDRPEQRLRVANAGWARWTPVNLAGIAAHVAGGAVLLVANKGRVAGQRGVARATIAKTALTGLALAATGSAWGLGAKLQRVGDAPVEGGTTPTAGSPEEGEGAAAGGGGRSAGRDPLRG